MTVAGGRPRRDWRRAAGIAVLALLCTEALLRVTVYRGVPGEDWLPPAVLRPMYQEDPQRLWRLKPGVFRDGDTEYRVNSLGLRGPEPSAPGGVLVLGDSCIFGFGVPEEDTLPRVLQDRLGVPVWNGGVPGYSSAQGLHQFPEVAARLKPSVTLVAYLNNDVSEAERPDHESMRSPAAAALRGVLRETCLYRFLGHLPAYVDLAKWSNLVLDPFRPGTEEDVEEDGVEEAPPARAIRVDRERFRQNLRAFALRGGDLGTRVVFLVLPDAWLEPGQGLHDVMLDARRAYQDDLRAAGPEVIDLVPLWPAAPAEREKWFQSDRFHPNAAGARLLGEQVAEAMERQGLAPGR